MGRLRREWRAESLAEDRAMLCGGEGSCCSGSRGLNVVGAGEELEGVDKGGAVCNSGPPERNPEASIDDACRRSGVAND